MNSNLDFSTASASVFSMDIDTLDFWNTDATDKSMELKIEISLSASFDDTIHTDVLNNKYYEDYRGHIMLFGLGKIFNDHILDWRGNYGEDDDVLSTLRRSVFVRFSYKYTEVATTYLGSCIREVYYSTRKVGLTPEAMGGYMPIINRKKKTFLDHNEPFYLLDVQEQRNLSVGLASLVDGATQYDEIDLEEDERNYSFKYYNLSPKNMLQKLSDIHTDVQQFLFYDVMLKNEAGEILDQCRYTIETRRFDRKQFLYLNMLGAMETVIFTGKETYEPDRSAQYGYAGEEYKALDLKVVDIYDKNSGYNNKTVMNQIRDMLESPSVYLWDSGDFRKIVIIDSSYSLATPTNTSYNVSIKYRFADETDTITEEVLLPWNNHQDVFEKPPFDRSFA